MPYDRPPAPDDLAPIEAFCDSARFLYGEDAFAGLASARSWLRARDRAAAAGALDGDGLRSLVSLREALRDHLEGEAPAAETVRGTLNGFSGALLGPPRWGDDGRAAVTAAGGGPVDAYAASVLAALATADLTGRLNRMKVCRAADCRWVYYDRSPANNGSWCSMDICGARNKMRGYRARRSGGAHG